MKTIVEDDPPGVHQDGQLAHPPDPPPLHLPYTDPDPQRPRERGPERASDLLAEPVQPPGWVLEDLLLPRDKVLLIDDSPMRGTVLGWQLAVQLSVGRHPFTLQKVPPLRVLLLDTRVPEKGTVRRLLGGLGRAAGAPLDNLTVMATCRGVTVPGMNRDWFSLYRELAPQLVITTFPVLDAQLDFPVIRLTPARWKVDGEKCSVWDRLVPWSDLAFRVSRRNSGDGDVAKVEPGQLRLRREEGQLLDRPGWPGGLFYRPRALERGQWPWTTQRAGSSATPSPTGPEAAWAAIRAHVREIGREPKQRELVAMLKAKGVEPNSLGKVSQILRDHQAEYRALLNAIQSHGGR